ncbi:MAG: serine/threonine-protein phosphatase [Chloroflexi bacterium]|nr:MAG: serine/threonine-protein phosphatase [Chloroflexota bacterium]
MTFVSAHACDIGRVHSQNDDFVWVDESAGLFIVADGMGGHETGYVASKMAATQVAELVLPQLGTQPPPTVAQLKTLLAEAIETANRAIFSAARQAEQKRKMGTTIVAMLVRERQAYISHAGDSRAYLGRGANLTQLTEDDSWGAQFAAAGVAAGEKGRFDHFLTKSVGQENQVDPSFCVADIQPGDWLLLCSDGLWNMVSDEEIAAALHRFDPDPVPLVEWLVAAANRAGGKDNISVVAVRVANGGSPAAD